MDEEISIRKLEYHEIDRGLHLIWETFLEFVAPDYSEEGIDTFRNDFIENEGFKDAFAIGRQVMYGAFINTTLAGVISYSIKNNVSCVFVHKNFQRKGIATRLFETVICDLRDKNVKTITLNASPYGEPFYRVMGFVTTSSRQTYHGIIYTPMELDITCLICNNG